jgi:predicted transcriptional regulator
MRKSPAYDWNGAKTRLTAHLPDDLVAAIQRAAMVRGQTLSVWVQRAAEQALRAQEKRR